MNSHDARPTEVVPGTAPQVEVVPGATPQAGVVPGAASGIDGSAVGGSPEWRQLSFRASGLTIELEIIRVGDYRRLTGQLIPRQPAVVHIRHADGVITVETDALGRFTAESVPLGKISLRSRLGPDTDQSPVTTGWIII